MKPAFLLLAALPLLALASCQEAEETDGPGYTEQETPNLPDSPADSVRLDADGIEVTGAGGTTLAFDSPRETVEKELARVLGPIADRGRNAECGAGPVDATGFPGGLTVNFQQGRMVGWFLQSDERGDGDIATAANIQLGSTAAEVEAAYDVERIEDSTLGAEFFSSEGIGGFFEGEGSGMTVQSLYAGTTCFFR